MNRSQNVVIFSARESYGNGTVGYLCSQLEKRNIMCSDWRKLFRLAHDSDSIALLPSLIKKIPTFDFALIVAEGVDTLNLRGNAGQTAMRDNVLFECGLCTMGLGAERVILMAQKGIRMPDDLVGVGKLGVHSVFFDPLPNAKGRSSDGSQTPAGEDELFAAYGAQIDNVANYINEHCENVSPAFVGASLPSAEAFFINFILRLLGNLDNGYADRRDPSRIFPFPENLKIRVLIPLPTEIADHAAISNYYQRAGFTQYVIPNAGSRGLFFYGKYDRKTDCMTVTDVPTSVTASSTIVREILNIDSDDEYDRQAENRFIAKEMDVYVYTLKQLLRPEAAVGRMRGLYPPESIPRILAMLQNVSVGIGSIESGE